MCLAGTIRSRAGVIFSKVGEFLKLQNTAIPARYRGKEKPRLFARAFFIDPLDDLEHL